MQIERDTHGMLQCHPYPNEYVDMSKQCAHCAFFMGLQRKEGVRGQEGQQFDIRGTVDEFRHEINMYMFWKPGMDIYVSHVRRRQLPTFVFPEGYKRPRASRHSNQPDVSCEGTEKPRSELAERPLKRKSDSETTDVNSDKPGKRLSISPQRLDSVSPESVTKSGSSQVSLVDAIRCLAPRDEDTNSEVRSMEVEYDRIGDMPSGDSFCNGSHMSSGGSSILKSDMTVVRNDVEPAELSTKSPPNLELIAPCELHGSRIGGTSEVGQNKSQAPESVSEYMEIVDTRSAEKLVTLQKEHRDVSKACNPVTGAENVDGLFSSKSGSGNLSCEVSSFY